MAMAEDMAMVEKTKIQDQTKIMMVFQIVKTTTRTILITAFYSNKTALQ